MHPNFEALVEAMHPAFERLIACPVHTGIERLPLDTPKRGVYLFSEGDDHLYVGRTNRLRNRHREHLFGSRNDAPFAFKLARHATGIFKGKGSLSRKALEQDPVFSVAFEAARERVREMDFRWVGEDDPNRQCLLEIYATVALGARFNDFENH